MTGYNSIQKNFGTSKLGEKACIFAVLPKYSSYILYLISLKVNTSVISLNNKQLASIYLGKSRIETFEKGVKYA